MKSMLFYACGLCMSCLMRTANRISRIFVNSVICLLAIFLAMPLSSVSAETIDDLTHLSIEQLMNIEITSVSKMSEKLSDSAAAVHVITADDIKRTGHRSIPEALRMVPGLHVAQVDSNKWAITSRGFNELFANHLLVLVDGRSVYTPFFAGVYWDVQDYVLEDLDRIEVIRGPGGTLWGSNAVNGVINIVTKSSKETQGFYVNGGAGTLEKNFGGFRYGGKLSDNLHYRVYTKYFDRENFVDSSAKGIQDDWSMLRSGVRVDWEPTSDDEVLFQADIYEGDSGHQQTLSSLTTPFSTVVKEDNRKNGGYFQTRWTRELQNGAEVKTQFYYDKLRTEGVGLEEFSQDTYDFELQYAYDHNETHNIIWGLGYRLIEDEIVGSYAIAANEPKSSKSLINLFIQDRITIQPDKLYLTAGTKFERNDYTSWEIQPSARALYKPHEDHTIWASVSRAVRIPSRFHDSVDVNVTTIPGTAMNSVIRAQGNTNLDSEELIAYELGYKVILSDEVSVDLSSFYNVYDNRYTSETQTAFVETSSGSTYLVIPQQYQSSLMEGTSYGAEVSANWVPYDSIKYSASYSLLKIDMDLAVGSTDTGKDFSEEGNTPQQQFQLRAQWDPTDDIDIDTSLYYVDELAAQSSVSSYLRLDLSVGWEFYDDAEFRIVGQNLLDKSHAEFVTLNGVANSEVPRSVYGVISYSY